MKVLVYNGKGGVGKTLISVAINQSIKGSQIITNDKLNPYGLIMKENEDFYLLPDDKEIPLFNDSKGFLIYDWAGAPDKRLKTFISNAKDLVIIIPFNSDIVSFQTGISIYNEIKDLTENIIFVCNRTKKGDYDIFKEQLEKLHINKALFDIKESKMFSNIFNKRQTIDKAKEDRLLNHTYKQALEQLNNLVNGVEKWKK